MEILHTKDGVDVKVWTPLAGVEPTALDQLRNIARLPRVFHHVAVMPDVHYGKGATVGSVIAMKGAVTPAAVGVDIGCGMAAIKTTLRASDLPDNLEDIRAGIERSVPVGFAFHDRPAFGSSAPEGLQRMGDALFAEFGALTSKVQGLQSKAVKQIGTLGGGNHFIELCLESDVCTDCAGFGNVDLNDPVEGFFVDKCRPCKGSGKIDPSVWLMLHSGSRNIGKELAEYHIDVARRLSHNQLLPDRDLATFLAGTPEMAAYRHDLFWAQRYAAFNRLVMLFLCKQVIRWAFPNRATTVGFEEPICCHHNYVAEESHFGEDVIVTRKGAISAEAGEMGIIPGSMGTASYIVVGLGNPESFCSASHGAGRRLSRNRANKTFTQADIEAQTAGVCCRKDMGIADELPGAYKDIDEVMRNQADLVEVVTRLKQVLCVKG